MLIITSAFGCQTKGVALLIADSRKLNFSL